MSVELRSKTTTRSNRLGFAEEKINDAFFAFNPVRCLPWVLFVSQYVSCLKLQSRKWSWYEAGSDKVYQNNKPPRCLGLWLSWDLPDGNCKYRMIRWPFSSGIPRFCYFLLATEVPSAHTIQKQDFDVHSKTPVFCMSAAQCFLSNWRNLNLMQIKLHIAILAAI